MKNTNMTNDPINFVWPQARDKALRACGRRRRWRQATKVTFRGLWTFLVAVLAFVGAISLVEKVVGGPMPADIRSTEVAR